MSVPIKRDKCGTYAGYQTHKRYGEKVCPECRAAATEYARERRHSRSDVRAREMQQHLARMRAWKRLADMHPTEFQALYDEESRDIPPRPYTRITEVSP